MNAVVVHDVGAMERMAKAFAASKLFGVQNVDQALALCLIAQAEGRHPATAAQDYHILQGRPAKKADAMLRDFLGAGGKVEWHELTDAKADATFSHPAGGSARIDWTLERAKKAQLTTAMWTKYPRQMLRARVVSEGVRTVFPMATSGMYVPEEVAEFGEPQAKPQTATAELRDVTPREPEPAALEAPKGPSAYSAKKAETTDLDTGEVVLRGDLAGKLNNQIPELASIHDAAQWRMKWTAEVDQWPKPWRDALWERFDLHVEELDAASGQEPEPVGQDPRGTLVYAEEAA